MTETDELWTYLNGKLVRGADAVIPIRDRGILWGDAVYDSIRTYNGAPFSRDFRLDRFFRSLYYARIDPGLSKDELKQATEEVLGANLPLLEPNEDLSMNLQSYPLRLFCPVLRHRCASRHSSYPSHPAAKRFA